MRIPRFPLLFMILLLLSVVGVAGARQMGQHLPRPYNCLHFEQTKLQISLPQATHNNLRYTSFVSPDGHYESKPLVIPGREGQTIVIEDRRIRRYTILGTIAPDEDYGILWSSDSQYVVFSHQSTWTLYSHTQEKKATFNAAPYGYRSFSEDSRYLGVFSDIETVFISLDTFRPEFTLPIGADSRSLSWSPTGHQVAFLAWGWPHRLVIADPDAKAFRMIPFLETEFDLFFHVSPRAWANLEETDIVWSADHRYVAVVGGNSHIPERYVAIYSSEKRLARFFVGMYLHKQEYPGLKQAGAWAGHQFFYMKVDRPISYNLWTFDADIGKHHQVESGISQYAILGNLMAILKHRGTGTLLEIGAINDPGSFVRHTFPLHYLGYCGWEANNVLLRCTERWSSDQNMTLFGSDGRQRWPEHAGEVVVDFAIYFLPRERVQRFAMIVVQQGDRFKVDILDAQTGKTYRLPAQFAALSGWNENSRHTFRVYPAPNEQSWLVILGSQQTVFRLWPADHRWELVYHREISGDYFYPRETEAVWSPDSQRFAVTRRFEDSRGSLSFLLRVREAEGDQEWDLGRSGGWMEYGFWTQCGGIWTVLRGE